ncbi:MAG: small ribosomal subunit Rsm22 family protein [Hyphomicrobiales bacterium]
MGTFPGLLDEAVAAQIAARQTGRLSAGAARLTARYRAGKASQGVDLSAYLAARLPATFAVNQRVLSEVAAVVPAFQPGSVADLGAGPGTSGWAAATAFATVAQVTQVELAADFVGLLRGLNARQWRASAFFCGGCGDRGGTLEACDAA